MSTLRAAAVGTWALGARAGGILFGGDTRPAAVHSRRSVGGGVPLARSGVDGWKATSPRPAPGSRRAGEVDDAGFTLVEMLLVLLVMGILLAIAIPTFLGTTSAADDRSAQSNLVTAFTDAKSQFQENGQTYGDTAGLVGLLGEAQLDLQFKDGSTGPTIKLGSSGTLSDISVSVSSDGNGVVLGAYSVPGNCFYIVDNAQALAPPASSLDPYLGTAPGSRQPQSVHGAIGLPTAAGTFYVTVAGDQDKNDCNASTPSASGSGISAVYQTDGFAPGVST